MSNLLKKYIRMVVAEGDIARVPNQLLSPDEHEDEQAGEELEAGDVQQEFSSMGGGAVMGYSLPLGMNPDAAGRQKNRPRRKNKK